MSLHIDTAYFHEVCIAILYGFLAVLTFVLIERIVYYGILQWRVRRIRTGVDASGRLTARGEALAGRDLVARSVADYVAVQDEAGITRARVEDLSAALFLKMDARVSARLWVLDTIVTAAPLLGLLGTILGIMDTFDALSAGGISDPAAVSRGIAAALLATAIGIGTALYGLLAHNLLHRVADVILEEFKSFLLAATR